MMHGVIRQTFCLSIVMPVSRSAAVCAAAKRYLGFDDMDIFHSSKYEPNYLVYTTIRGITIGKSYMPKQDEERFLVNDFINK